MKGNSATCILMLLIASVLCTDAWAQRERSDRIKPRWMAKLPAPANDSFSYKIVSASGTTLEDARKASLGRLMSGIEMKNAIVLEKGSGTSTRKVYQLWENGRVEEKIVYESESLVNYSSDDSIRAQIILNDEYWVRDGHSYNLFSLYSLSENRQDAEFDPIRLSSQYGMLPALMSIVPGAGQLYKGDFLKGGIMAGGCLVGAGGIIFFESQRKALASARTQTHDVNLIKQYAANEKNLEIARNVSIGISALLYLFNAVDAATAPGARRVVISPDGARFNF